MAENAAAHPLDQGRVPRHHGGKRILIVVDGESMQQFAIAVLRWIGDAMEPPQMIEYRMQRIAGHETRLA